MAHVKRPIFGDSWTEHQVEVFEQWKSEVLDIPDFFAASEAECAWFTWQVLTVMLAKASGSNPQGNDDDELEYPAPHELPSTAKVQANALEIVCRRLVGDSDSSSGIPRLKPRENAPPLGPRLGVPVLIDRVDQWLKKNEHLVTPDQLERLKAALEIALADLAAYKKAMRSRRR